ncbi:MAG TPA: GGDEF domain-containing protein, partial [Armatimonadota bacterium]
DEYLAVSALQSGAQDYLVKGQTDGALLLRAMRYAFERQRMQSTLRSLSLTDELTGLYNRRGFLTLAEHQLKVAYRMQEPFVLVYLDIDGMKIINDTFGHQAGDQALMETAAILRSTFRESDIIARIGGDEFVVIGLDGTQEQARVLPQRLQAAIDARNDLQGREGYLLSISIGLVDCQPAAPITIEPLLARADALMYAMKHQKKVQQVGGTDLSSEPNPGVPIC